MNLAAGAFSPRSVRSAHFVPRFSAVSPLSGRREEDLLFAQDGRDWRAITEEVIRGLVAGESRAGEPGCEVNAAGVGAGNRRASLRSGAVGASPEVLRGVDGGDAIGRSARETVERVVVVADVAHAHVAAAQQVVQMDIDFRRRIDGDVEGFILDGVESDDRAGHR